MPRLGRIAGQTIKQSVTGSSAGKMEAGRNSPKSLQTYRDDTTSFHISQELTIQWQDEPRVAYNVLQSIGGLLAHKSKLSSIREC